MFLLFCFVLLCCLYIDPAATQEFTKCFLYNQTVMAQCVSMLIYKQKANEVHFTAPVNILNVNQGEAPAEVTQWLPFLPASSTTVGSAATVCHDTVEKESNQHLPHDN